MDDLTKRFINYIQYEKRLSPNTLIAYQSDIAQFSAFILTNFGQGDLLTVESQMIRSWTISLIESKEQSSTVNRKISCLKSFYKFQLKDGKIKSNPTSKIIRPKSPKRLPKDISANKLVDVKDHLELQQANNQDYQSVLDYSIFMTFYLSGIRRSELIDLTWRQVDFSLKQISVIGKGKKQRFVPIEDKLIEILEAYQKSRMEYEIASETDHVFVLGTGAKLYPNYAYRVIKNNLSLTSAQKGIGPHTLRHSFATHLLNEGAELNSIKGLLGHSSLASTQVYTSSSIEKLKKIHQFAHPKS